MGREIIVTCPLRVLADRKAQGTNSAKSSSRMLIAGILPAKLDVTIEHELFAAASTFAEAFRIARQHVSDEETLELKAIEHETNRD